MNDGGGWGTAPAPDFSGTQTLQVEPASIPGALDAFREARERVEAELSKLNGLTINNWAGDPVSAEAAGKFTERTSTDIESAKEVLVKYREQLDRAVDALSSAYKSYMDTEGANTAMWGKKA